MHREVNVLKSRLRKHEAELGTPEAWSSFLTFFPACHSKPAFHCLCEMAVPAGWHLVGILIVKKKKLSCRDLWVKGATAITLIKMQLKIQK